jgi:membrane-associated protease RseP (regulator of RpoE activity)
LDEQRLPEIPTQSRSSVFPAREFTLPVSRRRKTFLPAALLLLTFLTTLTAGFLIHIQFVANSEEELAGRLFGLWNNPLDLLSGLPFALSILVILLAHEMGHYLTCRYYGIEATLPYVIPAPPPVMPFGTFGAVIRIKSVFLDRRQLFDVGIAGPLAGFIFIIPALIIGLQGSNEFEFSENLEATLEFGEPLLFQLGVRFFYFGQEGGAINLHPVGWAAWFGMLATSLNLLPIGQLDGGHIVYALFGPKGHKVISYATFVGLVILSLYSWPMLGYLVFALVLLFLRFRHPRPFIDQQLNEPGRTVLAVAGLITFILTFIPVPVQLIEHVGRL